MPTERSLYRKIQEILDTAKAEHVESLEDLRGKLDKRQDQMFKTYQYDPEKDAMRLLPSPRVIRNAVRICCLIGMISNEGHLTDAGRQALQRKRFASVIASQVRQFLRQHGLDLAQMNRAISDGLEARPMILPTSIALWEATGSKLPKGIFTRLLTLLGHAGGAESVQRKIYLHIATE
jgi:hypothetical protein